MNVWLESLYRRRWWFLAVAVIAVVLLPFLGPTATRVATVTMLYMILALGLNIVPGFTGLLDLGYVGFYAVGAYTAGLLTVHYDWPIYAVVPVAALHGALWGVALGAPTLRLTGDYFAIVTFGFSELVVLALNNEIWLTRGPNGLTEIIPDSGENGFVLTEPWHHHYVIGAMLALVIVLVRNVEHCRVGRAWLAIREDPIAAEACGVNLIWHKILAFALSAAIAGLAGALFARMEQFISPPSFTFWESILVLCLVVLGGMGSIVGVIAGALVLYPSMWALREALGALGNWGRSNGMDWLGNFGQAHLLMLGVAMIVIMRFRPAGLLPRRGISRHRGHGTGRFVHYAGAESSDPDDANRVSQGPQQ
jgi:branched-chain amino acid transport system permease protein